MPHTLHYLSPAVADAARLTPSRVAAHVKAGWTWHRLSPGFGAVGGTASYSRALVAPDGRIAFVSDRAEDLPCLDSIPPLHVSYALVRLRVPFADKDEAKAMGAVWVAHEKTWACPPDRVEDFARWIVGDPSTFDLLQPAPQENPHA